MLGALVDKAIDRPVLHPIGCVFGALVDKGVDRLVLHRTGLELVWIEGCI